MLRTAQAWDFRI